MFKEQPILYYKVPKTKHYILSGLATLLVILSCALIGLSIGTEHWREAKNPGHNFTKVEQGLMHECDRSNQQIACKSVEHSRFLEGNLGVLTITHSILIGSLTFGMLALFSAVLASFHKKHVFVTATVALEISSALVAVFAVSVYTSHFIKSDGWKFGWSYALAWIGIIAMATASILHFIVQDVKFLGKKICV